MAVECIDYMPYLRRVCSEKKHLCCICLTLCGIYDLEVKAEDSKIKETGK